MIVTDDPNIRSIQPQTRRVIFLSTKEFGDQTYNPGDLKRLWVSSLKKQEDDSYIVDVDHSSSGYTYSVKKTPKGWVIKMTSTYIE